MSYCRLSESDSNVYVYGTRDEDGTHGIVVQVQAYEEIEGVWKPMKGPYAGDERMCKTPTEAIIWLKKIRKAGYRVPDRVLKRLLRESKLQVFPDRQG